LTRPIFVPLAGAVPCVAVALDREPSLQAIDDKVDPEMPDVVLGIDGEPDMNGVAGGRT
jgi:hypothetical protein